MRVQVARRGRAGTAKECRTYRAGDGSTFPVDPGTNNGNSWAIDACKYCYYRPLAPAHIPPGHADHWWYGTGRGDHNPRRCQACKRFLAEGCDRQRHPRYADHMAQCVKADKRLRTAG